MSGTKCSANFVTLATIVVAGLGDTFFSIELGGIKNPTEPIKVAARSVFARLK